MLQRKSINKLFDQLKCHKWTEITQDFPNDSNLILRENVLSFDQLSNGRLLSAIQKIGEELRFHVEGECSQCELVVLNCQDCIN